MSNRGTRRLSLEVSNSAVRMAELALGGGKPRLIKLGQVRLPQRAVIDGAVVNVAAVQSAIVRCVKEGGFSLKEVHLGVAGLRAITRELDMPPVPDSELDSAVRLQALDVIPFPIEKTLISARPLEDVLAPDGSPLRRVLLAAAHRDLISPLLAAVQKAGLRPVSIDLTSMALIRSLYDPERRVDGPEAIVSIGAGLTTVVVHEQGIPHFVRTIAEGGDTITAGISGALDLPIEDAEKIKRTLDQAGPHIRAAATAAEEASNSLVSEIRNSIEYYSSLPGRSEVRRVTLTGGGAFLFGLYERLQQQLRGQVTFGSALSGVDGSLIRLSEEEKAERDVLLAVAVGLALPERSDVKQLDLLPPEVKKDRKNIRRDRVAVAAATLLVLAMAGAGALRYLQVHKAENKVSALETEIASTSVQINKYDKARIDVSNLRRSSALLTPIVQGEVNWPAVLASVQKNTPTGGIVTSFVGNDATPVKTTSNLPTSSAAGATSAEQIATVTVTVQAQRNYPYFQVWYDQLARSGQLQLTEWSPFAQSTSGTVTYSATISVLGTIKSARATIFEVPNR